MHSMQKVLNKELTQDAIVGGVYQCYNMESCCCKKVGKDKSRKALPHSPCTLGLYGVNIPNQSRSDMHLTFQRWRILLPTAWYCLGLQISSSTTMVVLTVFGASCNQQWTKDIRPPTEATTTTLYKSKKNHSTCSKTTRHAGCKL
jgi:hypothetical protein